MLNEDEIDLLLTDLLELHGYDFKHYSRDSLKRRISRIFRLEKFRSFAEFRERIVNDKDYITHLIDRITVNVTEMFRDSAFFRELRQNIIPALAELPVIRIWHAGCSTGEEALSMAILLHEAGLLYKARIQATDINPLVLQKARSATYPNSLVQLYARNYGLSGGTGNFNDYLLPGDSESGLTFRPFLREAITFEPHNLATGIYIRKFNLVVCRNVLIYFDKEYRERAFSLFNLSLGPQAYLALGEKETLRSSIISSRYSQVGKEKIWQKIK